MNKDERPPGEHADAVPLFRSWRIAYVVIVLAFVVQVAIFYFFDRYFS